MATSTSFHKTTMPATQITSGIRRALDAKPVLILDGAMGTELHRRDVDTGLPLWSANALLARPNIVLQIHKEYIAAGADIITTNTFRTTKRTFRRANLPDRSKQVTKMAVQLAAEARESFPDHNILIAGSIAPLEDCYRPDLVPPDDQLRDEHGEIAERLAGLDVDFLLLETMNTIREAYAACMAAAATGKEFIVSFVCRKDGTLYSGESLDEAVRTVAELRPSALSINCVSPRYLDSILNRLKSLSHLPIMAYGNIGVPEDERQDEKFTIDIHEGDYAAYAGSWLSSGVSIIGGCCGTTPEYIKALTTILAPRHKDTE